MQNTSDQFHNQHAASQQQCQLEKIQLECGPMPNMMAALPNIGGTPCSMPQIWLTPTTRVSCRNTAQMRNRQQISAVSRPKFTILSGHVEELLLFNKFFPIVDALVPKIYPYKVVRWCQNGDFLRPVFSESRVQHILDLHSKFALGPHHVWEVW